MSGVQLLHSFVTFQRRAKVAWLAVQIPQVEERLNQIPFEFTWGEAGTEYRQSWDSAVPFLLEKLGKNQAHNLHSKAQEFFDTWPNKNCAFSRNLSVCVEGRECAHWVSLRIQGHIFKMELGT